VRRAVAVRAQREEGGTAARAAAAAARPRTTDPPCPSTSITTKWSSSPGRIGSKERWHVADGFELRPRWSIDLYTPEVAGSLGAPGRRPSSLGREAGGDGSSSGGSSSPSRARARVDPGHCHVRVPRVDAVVDVDRAAATLARWVTAATLAPARAALAAPRAAARAALGRGKARARALAAELASDGLVSVDAEPAAPPGPRPPPSFSVRGWPWSLALADALDAGAAKLRAASAKPRVAAAAAAAPRA
jgi:hypothetical protein